MKRLGWAALLAVMMGTNAGSALASQDGWMQVGDETVRYFLPGSTPPEGADLAPAGRAASLATGANFTNNEWLLIGTEHVKQFIQDAGTDGAQLVNSAFVDSRDLTSQYYIGLSPKIEGEWLREPSFTETDSSKWTVADRNAVSTKLSIPVYQVVHKPWTIYRMYGQKTTTIVTNQLTYRANKPTRTTSGETIMNTRTFTRLEDSTGSIRESGELEGLRQIQATGSETITLTDLDPFYRLLSNAAVDVKDPAAAAGQSKSATFVADASSGTGKTTLAGSRKRVVFKADTALVSTVHKAAESETRGGETAGTITIDESTRAVLRDALVSDVVALNQDATESAATTDATVNVLPEARPTELSARDWEGDFTDGTFAVRVEMAANEKGATVPRFKLFKKVGGVWLSLGSDFKTPSGTLNDKGTSFDDNDGTGFYTKGKIKLELDKDGNITLSGKFRGTNITGGKQDFNNLIKVR